MEPDQLKNLRDKINSLELQPVSWQKEFVWQRVSNSHHMPSVTFHWKYAAAFVLIGIIGYSNHHYQKLIWESSAKRIGLLEKQIESENQRINRSLHPEEEKCLIDKSIPPPQSSVKKKPEVTSIVKVFPVSIQNLNAINHIDSLSTDPLLESVVSIEEKPKAKKITPIIGKIPLHDLDVLGKERKVKIQLNKQGDPVLLSTVEVRPVLVSLVQ